MVDDVFILSSIFQHVDDRLRPGISLNQDAPSLTPAPPVIFRVLARHFLISRPAEAIRAVTLAGARVTPIHDDCRAAVRRQEEAKRVKQQPIVVYTASPCVTHALPSLCKVSLNDRVHGLTGSAEQAQRNVASIVIREYVNEAFAE